MRAATKRPWRVRYETDFGNQGCRTFPTRRQAEEFVAEMRGITDARRDGTWNPSGRRETDAWFKARITKRS